MKLTAFVCIGLVFAILATEAGTPSAQQVIEAARVKASAENKAIFVHFGASWCGWCRKMDAFLDREDIKPVFEKYFVPVKLVVSESEKNKALENPGADALLQKVGGPDGLPFSAFLDAKGALIANSRQPSGGGNIGHPFQTAEVDYFVVMMKKAAPQMSEADLATIQTALRNQKK